MYYQILWFGKTYIAFIRAPTKTRTHPHTSAHNRTQNAHNRTHVCATAHSFVRSVCVLRALCVRYVCGCVRYVCGCVRYVCGCVQLCAFCVRLCALLNAHERTHTAHAPHTHCTRTAHAPHTHRTRTAHTPHTHRTQTHTHHTQPHT